MATLLPALRVGGRYRARVVRLMADGRIRLLLSGGTLTARAEVPVREGQELVVEVLRLVPEIVLHVCPGRNDLPDR